MILVTSYTIEQLPFQSFLHILFHNSTVMICFGVLANKCNAILLYFWKPFHFWINFTYFSSFFRSHICLHSFFKPRFSLWWISSAKSSISHFPRSASIEKAVDLHLLIVDNQQSEEIYVRSDQSLDPSNSLHNIHEAYCRLQTESLCNYRSYYARIMMTIYFSDVVSPTGTTYETATHNIHVIKLRKVVT